MNYMVNCRTVKQTLLFCMLWLSTILVSCNKEDISTNPIAAADNPGTIDPASDPTGVVRVVQIQSGTVVDQTAPTSTSNSTTPQVQAPTSSYGQIQQGERYDVRFTFRDSQGDVISCIVTAEGATNHIRITIPSPQQPGSLNEVTIPMTFPNTIRPGVVRVKVSVRDAANNVGAYVSIDIVIGAPIPGDARTLIVGTWRVVQVVNVPTSAIGQNLIFDANGTATDIDSRQYTYTISGTRVSFSSGTVYEIVALNLTNLIMNEVGGFGRYGNFRRL
jgi:hypothetical protein